MQKGEGEQAEEEQEGKVMVGGGHEEPGHGRACPTGILQQDPHGWNAFTRAPLENWAWNAKIRPEIQTSRRA